MKSHTRPDERLRAYFLLVLPAVTIYFAVIAFPTIFSITLSLTDYSGGIVFGDRADWSFVGFKHYFRMFRDQYFWIAFKNNIWIMLMSLFIQIPLGFTLAYTIFRKLIVGREFFQTIIYMPTIISCIVVAVLWQTFFSPYGPITDFMRLFNPLWENNLANDPNLAILPVLFVMVWYYTGMYLIIFLANLQKIDSQILEAAQIDGANERQMLFNIILPALSGVVVVTAILAISGSLKSFDLIFAMTSGNPARRTSVLALYMYDNAFKGSPDYPLANAISTFMVAVSFALILVTKKLENRFGGKE
ncbi:MAG: sugar ABC transporter permease [Spirochaetales bacterium]|nr:MAG: sugar ABC transporter permease [Spirochaetales bacterium]